MTALDTAYVASPHKVQQRRTQRSSMNGGHAAIPKGSPPRSGRRTALRILLFSTLIALLAATAIPFWFPEFVLTSDQVQQVTQFFERAGLNDALSTLGIPTTTTTTTTQIPSHLSSNITSSLRGGHTNNWAVLVCTSKFWFNYRHIANTLGMYRTVKRLGIPDSNIILMLADDAACNPRNKFPGNVWSSTSNRLDLYGHNIEVDYRGYEVSVENLIRLLTGRLPPTTPKSKRLETDARSNVFLYMTGHGGDEFLKFQDYEEISAFDIADAVEQMWQKKRYHQLFFMVDTCQANTLYSKIYSPNVLATGSSEKGQNSYSHGADDDLGVAMIDRFTNFVLQWMEGMDKTSNATMKQLFDAYDSSVIESDPGVRTDLFGRDVGDVKVTDFFGGDQISSTSFAIQDIETAWRVLIQAALTSGLTDFYAAEQSCFFPSPLLFDDFRVYDEVVRSTFGGRSHVTEGPA